jgi:hypothetical protein
MKTKRMSQLMKGALVLAVLGLSIALVSWKKG